MSNEKSLSVVDEQFHRFRSAMLLCFAASAALCAIVVQHRPAFAQELASLGVAFWVVAMMLLCGVAYYGVQRRLAARE